MTATEKPETDTTILSIAEFNTGEFVPGRGSFVVKHLINKRGPTILLKKRQIGQGDFLSLKKRKNELLKIKSKKIVSYVDLNCWRYSKTSPSNLSVTKMSVFPGFNFRQSSAWTQDGLMSNSSHFWNKIKRNEIN